MRRGARSPEDDLARGWSDEAVQIKPLVAVMAAGGRTAAARRPDLTQDRFQAEAVFIERPDFDRNRRVGALELADAGLELPKKHPSAPKRCQPLGGVSMATGGTAVRLNRPCSYRLALIGGPRYLPRQV